MNAAIAGTLTIDGEVNGGGTRDITISGNNRYRVMYMHSGADLTLQNLTVADGDSDPDIGSSGIGVYNNGGTLTIINSIFVNNQATGSGGGVGAGVLNL